MHTCMQIWFRSLCRLKLRAFLSFHLGFHRACLQPFYQYIFLFQISLESLQRNTFWAFSCHYWWDIQLEANILRAFNNADFAQGLLLSFCQKGIDDFLINTLTAVVDYSPQGIQLWPLLARPCSPTLRFTDSLVGGHQ